MASTSRFLVYIDGKAHWLTREEQEHLGVLARAEAKAPGSRSRLPNGNSVEGHSIAMSISNPTPKRIAEANEFCRKHGITGVRFDARHKHNCRITSNRDFVRYQQLKNSYNEDGGYHGY